MMTRAKPTTRKGPGVMILCRQLAARDARLSRVVAQTVVTRANFDQNEVCMGACTAAAAVLSERPNPVDRVGLEDALGKAFSAFDMTNWVSSLLLLRPIEFGVLLWSGLLKATANICLCFARQVQLLTWEMFGVWTKSMTRV